MRSLLHWVILVTLLASSVAHAQCEDQLDAETFELLLASSGESAAVAWPEGVFPLGHPMDIVVARVPDENPTLNYRAFVRRTGTEVAPKRLQVTSVSKDRIDSTTTVRVSLALAADQMPALLDRSSFLLVACGATVGNAPVFIASLDRLVSTHALGFLVAGAAFLVGLAVMVFAIRHLAKSAEGSTRSGPSSGIKSLFVDFRNRVSLSYFQVFVSFTAVFVAVAYVFGRTRQLSDLSTDVLLLLGISAGGAVAGKMGDIFKNRLGWDNWAWLSFDLNAFPTGKDAPRPHWFQLVSTQGQFDIYRFQALLFTLFVAPAFVVMSLYSLGEASIPIGILSVMGLSQVTYVAGKIAVQPTLKEFDDRVTELRKRVAGGEKIGETEARRFMQEFAAAMEMPWNPNSPLAVETHSLEAAE